MVNGIGGSGAGKAAIEAALRSMRARAEALGAESDAIGGSKAEESSGSGFAGFGVASLVASDASVSAASACCLAVSAACLAAALWPALASLASERYFILLALMGPILVFSISKTIASFDPK